MASFRRRRFRRRRRRPYYKKRRFLRRRRMVRRSHKLKSKLASGTSVGCKNEYELSYAYQLPQIGGLARAPTAGITTYGYKTFCAYVLPFITSNSVHLPNPTVWGSWTYPINQDSNRYITTETDATFLSEFRANSIVYKYMVDTPNVFCLYDLITMFKLSSFLKLYDFVRVPWIEITLSLPDRDVSKKESWRVDYHLLKGIHSCSEQDYLLQLGTPTANLQQGAEIHVGSSMFINRPKGSNWLMNFEDLVQATQVDSIHQNVPGWHSKYLNNSKSCKIRFRPKHSAIRSPYSTVVDQMAADTVVKNGRLRTAPNYAVKKLLSRGYVSTDYVVDPTAANGANSVWLTGPIIRLVNLNVLQSNSGTAYPDATKGFNDYHQIRVSFRCRVQFRSVKSLQPVDISVPL